MTPDAMSLPAGVRVFRSRPTHQVHAIRLHAANVDVVSQWVAEESSGVRPLWNDGRLYITSPRGLVSAGDGDYIVHSLFGFYVYSPSEFSTLYELADLPGPAAIRDMSVADLMPAKVADDCE
jgi:hypothetical protein